MESSEGLITLEKQTVSGGVSQEEPCTSPHGVIFLLEQEREQERERVSERGGGCRLN